MADDALSEIDIEASNDISDIIKSHFYYFFNLVINGRKTFHYFLLTLNFSWGFRFLWSVPELMWSNPRMSFSVMESYPVPRYKYWMSTNICEL